MGVAAIAPPVGLPDIPNDSVGVLVLCPQSSDQGVLSLDRENLRARLKSEPDRVFSGHDWLQSQDGDYQCTVARASKTVDASTARPPRTQTQDTPKESVPNAAGPMHESLKDLWWTLEYLPKLIHDPAHGFEPRWIIHRGRHRYIADASHIHQSVFDRMNLVATYRPPNLPERNVTV